MASIRVIQVGVGAIGLDVVAAVDASDRLDLVAAVDRAPSLLGVSLATLRPGLPPMGVLDALPGDGPADVAVVTTTSSVAGMVPVIEGLVAAGMHVVSTCEELAYPWIRHPDEAGAIDRAARAAGVAVIGGGINPGFLLDALPAILAWPLAELRGVRCRRMVDTRRRRGPLVRKTGAGLRVDEFDELAAKGAIGHVGLLESADMLAACLGGTLLDHEVELGSVTAPEPITVRGDVIDAGRVAGQRQTLRATTSTGVDIDFELVMAATVEEPEDVVELDGRPTITWRAAGGTDGDIGTVASVINLIRAVGGLEPGLRTMVDLLPVHPAVTPRADARRSA